MSINELIILNELNCRQNAIFIQQEVNYNTELKLVQNYSCNPKL